MEKTQFEQLFNEIKSEIRHQDYSAAIEEGAGLVALAKHFKNNQYLLLGKYLLGIAYYHLSDYKNSIEKYLELTNLVLDKELDLEKLDLKPDFLDRVRYAMAVDMYHLGDLEGASIILSYILENSKESSVILDSAILLGVIYLMMYDLKKNISFLAVTLELYLTLLEDTVLSRQKKSMIHNNLAILFTHQGDYQKAQEMLNNSNLQVTSHGEMLSIYNEMAHIHLQMKNFEKVQKNLDRAREYLNDCQNFAEQSYHYLLCGILQREEENYPEAQRLLEKAFFLAKKYNLRLEQIRTARELAILYEKMGHVGDSEFFLEYKDLKDEVNPVKEVILWSEVWCAIKDRVSLIPIRKNS